ncbi:glycosyltransferase family 2 protein [Marinicella meishanensis]|uniref:glycosyltransferase family 2 protein n=1 Tax=Marinicella meishanensis TaxID=2873263 RepID=UPI001CBF595B|nr:glycosyltransferase family 2 protein [Marinicella sp. NBU2979]
MDNQTQKVVIIMPAYNAEKTLEETLASIPAGCYDELILVDDCSQDGTVALAKSLGISVFEHESNKGYGGNQKLCYQEALRAGADIIVMLHPDNQYDASLIPFFTGFIDHGVCDFMLGARIRTRQEALRGGMPFYKYFSNRMLTLMMNVILGQNLAEGHSGFRVYHRRVLEKIPFENNSDDFSFDAELITQAVYHGFKLGDAPMPVRYFAEASSISFKDSSIYGLKILKTLGKYLMTKWRIKQSKLFADRVDSD